VSKEKRLRRRVHELETQMEKLVDIVVRLTACGHQLNRALSSVSGEIGLAIGGRLAAQAAILEREQAAQDGLRTDN
jgi:Flp pilus assembly protein TadB